MRNATVMAAATAVVALGLAAMTVRSGAQEFGDDAAAPPPPPGQPKRPMPPPPPDGPRPKGPPHKGEHPMHKGEHPMHKGEHPMHKGEHPMHRPEGPAVVVLKPEKLPTPEQLEKAAKEFGDKVKVTVDEDLKAVVLRGEPDKVREARRILTGTGPASRAIELVRLEKVDAEKVAKLVRQVMPEGLEIMARPAAKAIIFEGEPPMVRDAVRIAHQLDGRPEGHGPPHGPGPEQRVLFFRSEGPGARFEVPLPPGLPGGVDRLVERFVPKADMRILRRVVPPAGPGGREIEIELGAPRPPAPPPPPPPPGRRDGPPPPPRGDGAFESEFVPPHPER